MALVWLASMLPLADSALGAIAQGLKTSSGSAAGRV